MRSGSKTISTASAGPGWFLRVGLSFWPPVYPTLVEMTPSRWRSSSWTPQKQPPARIAVSVLSVIVLSLLRSSVSVAPAAAKQAEREEEDVEDVEEDRGGDRHGSIGRAAAQAVEVEDRERAEDPESGDGVDEVAVGDRDEDRDEAEGDQAEQGPEQGACP